MPVQAATATTNAFDDIAGAPFTAILTTDALTILYAETEISSRHIKSRCLSAALLAEQYRSECYCSIVPEQLEQLRVLLLRLLLRTLFNDITFVATVSFTAIATATLMYNCKFASFTNTVIIMTN